MKVLIYLGHPAHFHFYKYVIRELEKKNHSVLVVIKKKEILEELLQLANMKYINVMTEERKNSRFAIAWSLLKRDLKVLTISMKFHPDLMIGSSVEITHVGKILNIPSIVTVEDDINHVKFLAKIGYPLATRILVPTGCKVGKFAYKTNFYNGYQKLAYLHPNWFTPDPEKVKHLYQGEKRYFILRLVGFNAYHDAGERGIDDALAETIIHYLEPHGKVYINSERPIPAHLESYRLPISVDDIHHAMYYCSLFIADSGSMCTECALLATPSIRHCSLIGYQALLLELDHRFHLTFGIELSEPELMFQKIDEILALPDIKAEWMKRREVMLADKIDVTAFFVWYIENFPKSVDILNTDSDYQFRFK
ncbi:MAG TPA: DUF354 domain-containing protein [Candidatus Cloacimonadota bacterium]|nr:DUF354 domain-containing protein [Candidatus Cloacimonadota bacterium]